MTFVSRRASKRGPPADTAGRAAARPGFGSGQAPSRLAAADPAAGDEARLGGIAMGLGLRHGRQPEEVFVQRQSMFPAVREEPPPRRVGQLSLPHAHGALANPHRFGDGALGTEQADQVVEQRLHGHGCSTHLNFGVKRCV